MAVVHAYTLPDGALCQIKVRGEVELVFTVGGRVSHIERMPIHRAWGPKRAKARALEYERQHRNEVREKEEAASPLGAN